MSDTDASYLEAMNCFEFAGHIWESRQKDKYEDAQKAYDLGIKIYNEKFVEKNTCVDDDFEF
jgi:hypothetical protein